jgi:hypothetical protein
MKGYFLLTILIPLAIALRYNEPFWDVVIACRCFIRSVFRFWKYRRGEYAVIEPYELRELRSDWRVTGRTNLTNHIVGIINKKYGGN